MHRLPTTLMISLVTWVGLQTFVPVQRTIFCQQLNEELFIPREAVPSKLRRDSTSQFPKLK